MGAEMGDVYTWICLFSLFVVGVPLFFLGISLALIFFWRRRLSGPDPPKTFEGDMAYIARNRRERWEALRKRRGRGR